MPFRRFVGAARSARAPVKTFYPVAGGTSMGPSMEVKPGPAAVEKLSRLGEWSRAHGIGA
ncbi:hypothetical protein [Azospirillum largimobile]